MHAAVDELGLDVLSGRRPDRVVWCADLTYWVAANRRADLAGEEPHARFCRDLGCMPYYWYGKFWAFQAVYEGVDVVDETHGRERRRSWKCRAGTLSSETRILSDGSEAPLCYPVRTESDLDVLLHVLQRRVLRSQNLADYRERLDLWARYDGVPALGLPRSPLPAFFVEWAGVEHGSLLTLDCPEKVAAVVEMLEVQERGVVDDVCAAAPPVAHFADNLTGDVYTPFFSLYMEGPYRRRIGRLHAAGVRCAVHLDGAVRGLLPLLASTGIDAVEALTPLPSGDVRLEEMRDLAGSDSVVLWGGLPGAMFAPPFTGKDVQGHVQRLLKAWGGSPFILGVGDQVPPNGDIGLCRLVSDIVATAG